MKGNSEISKLEFLMKSNLYSLQFIILRWDNEKKTSAWPQNLLEIAALIFHLYILEKKVVFVVEKVVLDLGQYPKKEQRGLQLGCFWSQVYKVGDELNRHEKQYWAIKWFINEKEEIW